MQVQTWKPCHPFLWQKGSTGHPSEKSSWCDSTVPHFNTIFLVSLQDALVAGPNWLHPTAITTVLWNKLAVSARASLKTRMCTSSLVSIHESKNLAWQDMRTCGGSTRESLATCTKLTGCRGGWRWVPMFPPDPLRRESLDSGQVHSWPVHPFLEHEILNFLIANQILNDYQTWSMVVFGGDPNQPRTSWHFDRQTSWAVQN